eukprot:2338708-Ditylum_brightwellii.AAC.1
MEFELSKKSTFLFEKFYYCKKSITFYKQKGRRYYDESTVVKPYQKLDSAGETFTLQGVLKVNDIEQEASRDFTVKSLWSQLPTVNHETELADGILHTTMSRIDKYICVSIGPRKWQ